MPAGFRSIEGDIQTGAAPVTPQRNLGPGVALPNIFAGIKDFGTVTDPDTGETRAKAPVEWLMENVDPSNPLYQAFFGNTGPHTSTSLERLVGPDGTVYYQIAGKTGGPNRERYSQLYVEKGNQLVPVGQGKFYTGEPPDAFVKQFAGKALGMFAGVALPGIGSFIGQALGVSVEIGSAIANVALKLAQGVPLQDALLTAGIQYGAPQVFTDPTVAKIASDLGSAAATGQDMGQAAIKSLVSVAGPQVLENVRPTGDQVFDSGLASAISSAASAKLTGGDVIQSAVSGFTAGVQKASGQQQPSKEEQVAGTGPADYLVGEQDPALQQVGFGSTLRGILQSGLAELGSSWLAAGQQLGIAPETLDRAISYLKVIEQGGESLIDADVQQQAKAFTNRIYSAASKPNATASEIAQTVVQATLENPLGALTLVSKELVQELPTLLIPGKGAAMLGSWALNLAESAGGQALQKIDELRQANPNMTRDQLIAAARNDAGIAAAVTAAVSLIPGANTKVLQPLIEGFNEFLEEGLTTYLTTGDKNKALGSAVLGGVLGGKTATALQTGEQVADAAQKALPSLGTIEVKSTRLPLDVAEGGDKLSVVSSVVSKGQGDVTIPVGQVPVVNAVVVSTDPKNNTALVVDNTGATKIVGATDVTSGTKVTEGQTVVLNADGTIKTSGAVDTSATKVVGDGGGVTKGGTLLTTPQENLISGQPVDTSGQTFSVSTGVRRQPTTYTGDIQGQRGTGAARLDEFQRTFQGTLYPTVEARNKAMQDYYASFGIPTKAETSQEVETTAPVKPAVVSSANPVSVLTLLNQMGITPTQSMMSALLEGNPTNAEVLARIRSNPEILAAVAARGQAQDTFTKVGPGADVDTGTKIVPGDQVVTGGDVKVGGDVVTGGEIVQEQKPAEIDVANQPASQQDVIALLGRIGLPTNAAFVAELTKDNATNLQVLQRLQSDPAVQALVQQQRLGQTDTAIVISVDPSTNTALVIDSKGETKTIDAVDTKTGQALVQDQVITVPVATDTTQTFAFDPAASLIQTRFQENGKVATQQDIASLKAIAQQAGIDFTSETLGTTPAYQQWATLVNDTARGIKPYVAPTVTPEVKVDTGTKITPSVTESINLTFDPGRVNIDTPQETIAARDTLGYVDTTPSIDTIRTFDTVRTFDTIPAVDTTPVVDTVPAETKENIREDDLIRLLGLDQTEPTPTVAEQKEPPLSVVTRTVSQPPYTPPPGVRVVEPPGVSPTRVALSEREGEDVYGTPEEEQEPVWNIRSLKLRRALRI